MPASQAAVALARQGRGGHRDDRHVRCRRARGARIARVASKPSIRGIRQSISTTSKSCRPGRARRPPRRRCRRPPTRQPRFSSSPVATSWLTALSSTTSTRSPRAGGRRRPVARLARRAPTSAGRSRRAWRRTARRRAPAWSSGRGCPAAASSPGRPAPRRRSAPGRRRRRARRGGSGGPARGRRRRASRGRPGPGRTASPSAAATLSAVIASSADGGQRRPRRFHAASCSHQNDAVGGVVVDHQHPAPAQRLARRAGRGRARGRRRPSGAVNQNVLPAPGRAAHPDLAAHAARRAAARWPGPSPVPPCWRVVERSAWVKASKRPVDLGLVDPDAGVADLDPQPDGAGRVARRRAVEGQRRIDDLAAVGELHGVGAEVGEHLPEAAPGRRSSGRGTSGEQPTTSSRPLSWARSAPGSIAVSSTTARTSNSVTSSSSLPDSIFDRSRMSLMRAEQGQAGAAHAVGEPALLVVEVGAQRAGR